MPVPDTASRSSSAFVCVASPLRHRDGVLRATDELDAEVEALEVEPEDRGDDDHARGGVPDVAPADEVDRTCGPCRGRCRGG